MIKCYYAVCPSCHSYGEIEPFNLLKYAHSILCPVCNHHGENVLMNVHTTSCFISKLEDRLNVGQFGIELDVELVEFGSNYE